MPRVKYYYINVAGGPKIEYYNLIADSVVDRNSKNVKALKNFKTLNFKFQDFNIKGNK